MEAMGEGVVGFFRQDKSFQGNRYYSVFVCARSGRKLFSTHKKKSHYPLVYLKFCARVRRYPKLLVTNQAGEILSKGMGSRLAAQSTRIDPCDSIVA